MGGGGHGGSSAREYARANLEKERVRQARHEEADASDRVAGRGADGAKRAEAGHHTDLSVRQ